MVTASTFGKEPLFASYSKLRMLEELLFSLAVETNTEMDAWAIFPNHYHIVCELPTGQRLAEFVRKFHGRSAVALNRLDAASGRKVWSNYWDTRLATPDQYLPRLGYVHRNAEHHGIVPVARNYRFCSAHWFESQAPAAFVGTVYSFKTDQLGVPDSFVVDRQFLRDNDGG